MIRRLLALLFLGAFGSLSAGAAPLAAGAVAWEKTVAEVRISGVSFDNREATFRVVDNPPAARESLETVLAKAGAIAGTNGNYFQPDFTPLGLVISAGKKVHDFQTAKLLSGLLEVREGKIALARVAQYHGAAGVSDALQAGPWLVEKGAAVAGLNAVRPGRRTVIATDGENHWALLVTGPMTLAQTGTVLLTPGLCGGWDVKYALNLDGGSSTTLVVRQEGQTIVSIPSFGSVANYLTIVPRHR